MIKKNDAEKHPCLVRAAKILDIGLLQAHACHIFVATLRGDMKQKRCREIHNQRVCSTEDSGSFPRVSVTLADKTVIKIAGPLAAMAEVVRLLCCHMSGSQRRNVRQNRSRASILLQIVDQIDLEPNEKLITFLEEVNEYFGFDDEITPGRASAAPECLRVSL